MHAKVLEIYIRGGYFSTSRAMRVREDGGAQQVKVWNRETLGFLGE